MGDPDSHGTKLSADSNCVNVAIFNGHVSISAPNGKHDSTETFFLFEPVCLDDNLVVSSVHRLSGVDQGCHCRGAQK